MPLTRYTRIASCQGMVIWLSDSGQFVAILQLGGSQLSVVIGSVEVVRAEEMDDREGSGMLCVCGGGGRQRERQRERDIE